MPDPIELRRLLDEATPTPWELAFRDPAMNGEHWVTRHQGRPGICIAGFSYGHASGDANLIAAAVNALPELLEAAEALERVKVLYERVFNETPLHLVDRSGYAEGVDDGRDLLLSDLREAIDGEPHDPGD